MPSEIKGFESLLRKLSVDGLMAEPMRKFFTRASIKAQGYARRLSPVDTGRLRGSIAYRVDAAEVPMYAEIGTVVEYAPFIEYGTGEFADGPVSGKGGRGGIKPRRYLRGAVEQLLADLPSLIDQLGKDIQASWDKK